MKLSQNMLWAADYIKAANSLVDLSKIKSIAGYGLKQGQVPSQDAACFKASRGLYTIRVRLTAQFDANKSVLVEDALVALAHELAHVEVWEHTPEHLELTARILVKFSKVAKKNKVKDTSGYLRKRVPV